MATAFVVAAFHGTVDGVTRGAMESASSAVQIAIGLVGIMTLWLGMMRVAEAAGLVTLLGRALRPILRLMFPEVPAGSSCGRRDRGRSRRQHARTEQRGHAARHQGDGGVAGAQSRQGQRVECDGHFSRDDHLGRAVDPGDDDWGAGRRRLTTADRHHRPDRSSRPSSGPSPRCCRAKVLQRFYPATTAPARVSE